MVLKIVLCVVAAVNLIAFLVCGWDKLCARKGWWRIPERVLIGFAACLGSPGILLGMVVFHHKTRKPKFSYGVPAILVAQVVLLYLLARQI